MAAPNFNYSGNPDFRGWLAAGAGGATSSPYALGLTGVGPLNAQGTASLLLSKLGNDGRSGDPTYDKIGSSLYNQFTQAKTASDQYNQLLASINANRPPVPRMINFDSAGSWNKAREMATNAVSPIYQQKMTDFINRQQTELSRQQADTQTGKEGLDTALSRALADSQTSRARTSQDTNTNITDINATQAAGARSEGLSYDSASRALNEGLSASGTADTGLGRQQVTDANQARTAMSNEQVRQTANKVDAQNTLMNRTFQDLGTSDTRNTEDTTAKKGKLDLDMERFIEDQTYAKDQETKQESLDKEAEIANQSLSYQGQLVDQWISSLAGKGYTAQEIANAASIYK